MKFVNEYEVTVSPDGKWHVEWLYGYSCGVSRAWRTQGTSDTQAEGELAARLAIEDHKAEQAKASVAASMQRRFTVKA